MLAITSKGAQLPWTRCIVNDLRALAKYASLPPLGDPMESPEKWLAFIRVSGEKWQQEVEKVFYIESVLDKDARDTVHAEHLLTFSCEYCATPVAFPTRK
eukprot:4088671-Karenia_brevis.AAC.1